MDDVNYEKAVEHITSGGSHLDADVLDVDDAVFFPPPAEQPKADIVVDDEDSEQSQEDDKSGPKT